MASGALHCQIINFWMEMGHPPNFDWLMRDPLPHTPVDQITKKLKELQKLGGITLKQNPDDDSKLDDHSPITEMQPFSAAPTPFYVKTSDKEGGLCYWASCALSAIGIFFLVPTTTITIYTCFGAEHEQVTVDISRKNKKEKISASSKNVSLHLPPLFGANPQYFTQGSLFFKNEKQLDEWCCKHNLPRGRLLDLDTAFKLAKLFFSKHHSNQWAPWTDKDVNAMFKAIGLNDEFFQI
ncbi:uncharacterized protein LOC134842423 [Symsagittifera roscoffensis]|uniref:uncharacterized protein LOC134842423 n=1 Tax=Symsagittifera roscoffensis TaxID=84072 RepID=UPI00307C137E